MGLSDWATRKNRELRRKAMEDRDSTLWHSGAYHRYFEGYTEKQVTGPDGKTKLSRVYTGRWYRQALGAREYILVRLLYVVLFLLMAGMMAVSAVTQGSAGTAFYVVIPEMATLCLLAALAYTLLVNTLFIPKKMTVSDYKSSSGMLKRVSHFLVIAFLADLIATAAERFLLSADVQFKSFPVTMLAFLAGAVLAAGMEIVERKIPYSEEENPESEKADDGVTIADEQGTGIRS